MVVDEPQSSSAETDPTAGNLYLPASSILPFRIFKNSRLAKFLCGWPSRWRHALQIRHPHHRLALSGGPRPEIPCSYPHAGPDGPVLFEYSRARYQRCPPGREQPPLRGTGQPGGIAASPDADATLGHDLLPEQPRPDPLHDSRVSQCHLQVGPPLFPDETLSDGNISLRAREEASRRSPAKYRNSS